MSEILTGSTDEFFQGILRENLREPRNSTTAVLSIGGLPGSGVTTTCNELATILREDFGLPVVRFSSSDETYRLTRERTGSKFSEVLRDPQSVRDIDKRFAVQILSPENANSVILADGRHAAFVTTGLKQTGRNYPISLPFRSLGIYLHADKDIRIARKYLDARMKGPVGSFDEYQEELAHQISNEETAFLGAYSQTEGLTPDNMAFTLNGEDVYNLRYSTDSARPLVTAQKIASNEKVQELLGSINRT